MTLAMLALAAPPALARPITDRPAAVPAEPNPAAPAEPAGESFDWGAAGVGGAATAVLALVATGGLAAAQRGRSARSVAWRRPERSFDG